MSEPSIFDDIPWPDVGLAALHTFTLYWLLLIGLKVVGRRVFAELGPQDFILLLLIAESCGIALAPPDAGYWGVLASVLTLLITVAVVERVKILRRATENHPVTIYRDGEILVDLKKYLLTEEDLDRVARQYGRASYHDFELLVLEDDGNITGVVRERDRANEKQQTNHR